MTDSILLEQEFSIRKRKENIEKLKKEYFDVLVIGGGITGAGTACEASNKGLKVALVEMRDFASGTSSRSSKLLHGGVRYLEQFEFKLVFEALSDRNKLFKKIPQIAKPLSFLVPIYKGYKEGLMWMNLGLSVYDFLSVVSKNAVTGIHKLLPSSNSVSNYEPEITKDKLKGAIKYFDGVCDDARLTIENIKTASELGAVISNYVKVIGFEKDFKGRVVSAIAKDLVTGEDIKIKANAIVNASGPWVDSVNKSSENSYKNKLKPTKGVHIIVPKITDGNALLIKTPVEPVRWAFIIPYGNYSIVGTTDTEAKTKEDDFSYLDEDNYATEDEIKYLLSIVNHYYPNLNFTEKDIISSYGGWRPLMAPESDSISESDISRDHEIFETESGIICIGGGKLTAFMSMSKDIVNYVMNNRNINKKYDSKKEYPELLSWKSNLSLDEYILKEYNRFELKDRELINNLIQKYGTEYSKVLIILNSEPEMREKISNLSDDCQIYRGEIIYSILFEMCMTISDFMVRRNRIILKDTNQGLAALDEISQLFESTLSNILDISQSDISKMIQAQKEEYIKEVTKTNESIVSVKQNSNI